MPYLAFFGDTERMRPFITCFCWRPRRQCQTVLCCCANRLEQDQIVFTSLAICGACRAKAARRGGSPRPRSGNVGGVLTDGSTIAFTGEYDGKWTSSPYRPRAACPAADFPSGPRRERGLDPDGKRVLFIRTARCPTMATAIHDSGGRRRPAEELPLPIAEEGSYSPDVRTWPTCRCSSAGCLEAVPRRQTRKSGSPICGFERGPDSAREFERLQSDVVGDRIYSSPTAKGR